MSSDEPGQMTIFDTETVIETETVPATVWVVASRKEDSPHPHVESVYDTEDAAQAHKKDLADNSFQHGVVAWTVFECDVKTGGEDR